jgi:hypothetical protein
VQGRKPNGDTATTIFDLLPGRRHVMVYPATVDTYAVTVPAAGVRMLASTATSGTSCAVPAEHATHGRRLLGLRPYSAGAMELYLVLPGAEIHIVYRDDRLRLLVTILAELTDSLT